MVQKVEAAQRELHRLITEQAKLKEEVRNDLWLLFQYCGVASIFVAVN